LSLSLLFIIIMSSYSSSINQSLHSIHNDSKINSICRQQWHTAGQTGLRKLALTAAQKV